MSSGTGMPQASRSVGAISTRLTICLRRPPPVKGPPVSAMGIRTELSWQERLYSAFLVLK